MAPLKLVLVEDDKKQVSQYRAVLDEYVRNNQRLIEMDVCPTVGEAPKRLDSTVDAVVVDLNLGGDTGDGTKVIDAFKQLLRVPVVIYTGTPADADDDPPVVGVFTKGQHGFNEVLDCLWKIYSIG